MSERERKYRNESENRSELRRVYLAGGLSSTLVLPIEMARKYGLDKPSNVLVEDTDKGILIRPVKLEALV